MQAADSFEQLGGGFEGAGFGLGEFGFGRDEFAAKGFGEDGLREGVYPFAGGFDARFEAIGEGEELQCLRKRPGIWWQADGTASPGQRKSYPLLRRIG